MDKTITYLAVGLGSALGGMGRFWIAGAVGQRWGDSFPWGTILVNISESFVIGLLAALSTQDGQPRWNAATLNFLLAGICGGYTTFSAFSLQTLKLLQAGNWTQAGGNILLSLLGCLFAVWLGHLAGQFCQR
jgi:fluoride exporter